MKNKILTSFSIALLFLPGISKAEKHQSPDKALYIYEKIYNSCNEKQEHKKNKNVIPWNENCVKTTIDILNVVSDQSVRQAISVYKGIYNSCNETKSDTGIYVSNCIEYVVNIMANKSIRHKKSKFEKHKNHKYLNH